MSLSGASAAQVVTYEGNTFPEEEGWERRLADTPGAERTLENGWLVLYADLPEGWTSDTGDADNYRMALTEFVGAPTFFVEWRAVTDNPSWVLNLYAVPTVVAAGGRSAALYHTTFSDSLVQLFRDTFIPIVNVPITVDVPHVYRVELYGAASYTWYIDGRVVDSGMPQGPYPDPNAFLIWGVRRSYVDATTAWDYVRFGVIPEDGSGDYNSDGVATLHDFYFFHECLTKQRPGINGGPDEDAGPGCRFADFDGDGDVDLLDFAEFQNLFAGSHP